MVVVDVVEWVSKCSRTYRWMHTTHDDWFVSLVSYEKKEKEKEKE